MRKWQKTEQKLALQQILISNAPPLVLLRFIEKCYQRRGYNQLYFFVQLVE